MIKLISSDMDGTLLDKPPPDHSGQYRCDSYTPGQRRVYHQHRTGIPECDRYFRKSRP